MVSLLPIQSDANSNNFFACMEMDPLHSISTKVPSLPDDPSKKIRKPYTITKSRENWSEQEHDKFLEALHLFDRDWKKIEAFVGSKTAIQIRSHAQKYFLKVQKNGTSEHVPPPRPKRKATHPYPQKASKSVVVVSQSMVPTQPSVPLIEPGYMARPDSLSVLGNPPATTTFPSWTYSPVPSADSVGLPGAATIAHNCSSSSNESASKNKSTHVKKPQWNPETAMKVMPDFAEVYDFIGSVFDPNASGHLQKLKKMDPINVETAVMLMKNLAINLVSPEFEEHSSRLVGLKKIIKSSRLVGLKKNIWNICKLCSGNCFLHMTSNPGRSKLSITSPLICCTMLFPLCRE